MRENTKKLLSILLCLCMLLQNAPMVAFAAAEDNLCEHHAEHTAECGYVEAIAGADCTHSHDDICSYVEAAAEVKCACEATDENGVLVHTEGCGYMEGVAGADCTHVHDGSCGYIAPVEPKPCTYHCETCHNHGEEEAGEEQETSAPSSEATEPSTETGAPAPVCTCGTDDESIHATTCAVYVAPENPQCYCAEKCTEPNVWCDICGFDYTQCTGTDEAGSYSNCNHAFCDNVCSLCGVAVTVDANVTYTAFAQNSEHASGTITVTVTVSDDSLTGGTFYMFFNDKQEDSKILASGTSVTLSHDFVSIEPASVPVCYIQYSPDGIQASKFLLPSFYCLSLGNSDATGGTVNGVTHNHPQDVYFPAGTSITLTPGSNDGFRFSHWEASVYDSYVAPTLTGGTAWEDETIQFNMPAGNITVFTNWICEHKIGGNWRDESGDHHCDVCGEIIETLHDDGTTIDHCCDVCNSGMPSLHVDINPVDHQCDVFACSTPMDYLCNDGDDNDHNCDVCSRPLCSDMDGDNDHLCDGCGQPWTICYDGDNNGLCDECGMGCAHTTIADGKCTACGGRQIFLHNALNWDQVNIIWKNDEYSLPWPGYTMEVYAEGIYTAVVPVGMDTVGFNGGPLPTMDMTLPEQNCFRPTERDVGGEHYEGFWYSYPCTTHTWEEGVCTNCQEPCAHSGGTATCTQKAVCDTCGSEYGEFHTVENEICTVCKLYGTCGEKAIWTFDPDTGKLTISGTGPMKSYYYKEHLRPWNIYEDDITSVVIESGITTVSEYGFYFYKNLTSVTLPEGLTEIGREAFCYSGLTAVDIPASVTKIDYQAFYSAELTNVSFRENAQLATIGSYAFAGNVSLTGIRIPANVSAIEGSAFWACTDLTTITMEGAAPRIDSITFELETIYVKSCYLDSYLAEDSGWLPYKELIIPFDDLAHAAVDPISDQAYSGSPIKPVVTVTDPIGNVLTEGTDYTVSYSNNTDVGTATVTLIGKGAYTGTKSVEFKIARHQHEWKFTADDNTNTITAVCANTDGICPNIRQTATLEAEDSDYTGEMVSSIYWNGIEGENVALHFTGTNGTDYDSADYPINAGSYTVTMTVGGKSVSDSFAITPKSIATCNPKLSLTSFDYTGKAPSLSVSAVNGAVGYTPLVEGTDFTVGTAAVNAGDHKLTVTGKGNYGGTVELDYTITAKEVTITGARIMAVNYDPNGYEMEVTGVTFNGVLESDTLAYTATAELTGTNAVGEREATVTVTLSNNNYTLKTATYRTKVTINKAVATVTTLPTGTDGLTYNGTEQNLITAGTTADGTMMYSLDENGDYSTNIPTGINAGGYTVWFYIKGDDNHSDSAKDSVTVNIDKASLTVLGNVTAIGTYGQKLSELTLSATKVALNDTEVPGTWTLIGDTIPNVGDTGSYMATFIPDTGAENYEPLTAVVSLTISKDDSSVIKAPEAIANLKFNGQQQALVTAGEANGGKFQYSLDNSTWSDTVPSGKNAGNYIVYFKVVGDSNHNDNAGGSVPVTIAKQDMTITAKDQTIAYGQTISQTQITSSGLLDGHSVAVTLTPSTTMLTDNGIITASNAVISANGTEVTSNYEISYGDPAKLVITFDTSAMDNMTSETVTSDDQAALDALLDTAAELLEEELTPQQKEMVEDVKAEAEALLAVIEAAREAIETENTRKVEDVTAENVKPEDKEDLEDARADLKKALEDHAGNYTEEEKKGIQDEIQRIDVAIEALENAWAVTDAITQLPDTVEPDDEDTAEKVLDTKEAYDELTDHEKSLVDETTNKKLDDLVAALTAYDIIKGDGGKWTKGSGYGLSFTANGPFSKFVGIEVDSKEVAAKYYEAKAGSTIITLNQSFLKRLSNGKHTITVLYTNGETSGTFKIFSQYSNPATGDDSNIMLWSGMLCVSTLGLVVVLVDRKRRISTK